MSISRPVDLSVSPASPAVAPHPHGWRERFAETGEIVRPIARSMAATHLQAGYDVVMPQYIGRLSEIERFEAVVLDGTDKYRKSLRTMAGERCSPKCTMISQSWFE